MPTPRKIILLHDRAPGDIVVMTALVRDIALAHPGKFQIGVKTSAMDLWRHNPYITDLSQDKHNVEYIKLDYGHGISSQNHETLHFMVAFHRDFEKKSHVKVPLLRPIPDLHLSEEERAQPLVSGRYWVFISGGKSDFTAKVWDHRAWGELVRRLKSWGIQLVQIGSTDQGHWHPLIPGTLNLVGKTNLRDMLRLIHHADGVVCGVTGAMHAAAALERACVVIAGGREAWWWEGYVRENAGLGGLKVAAQLKMPHRFLHTIGLLDCCTKRGCWRSKTIPLHDDPSVCKYPILRPGQATPRCLDMISPAQVETAVLSYYIDGGLPVIPDTRLAEELQAMQAVDAALV